MMITFVGVRVSVWCHGDWRVCGYGVMELSRNLLCDDV